MKDSEGNVLPTIEKSFYMRDQKKHISFQSPDTNKMQVVIIDDRTKIYIAQGANADEARRRYLNRLGNKENVRFAVRKPMATT